MQSESIQAEFANNMENGRVGTQLVSETNDVRVWHVVLQPGERLPPHRHVLDYFWTAMTDGKARSNLQDGSVIEAIYKPGDTKHFSYAKGESMMHDLQNTGDTVLMFTTVEFKNSANEPL